MTPAEIKTAAALLNQLDAMRRLRDFLDEHRWARVRLEADVVGLAAPVVEIDSRYVVFALAGAIHDAEALAGLRGIPVDDPPPPAVPK